MEYRQFSAVELAADAAFIDWVQRPNATRTAFWEDFLTEHPDRATTIVMARQLVTDWHIDAPPPPAGSMEEVWLKIQADVKTSIPERSVIRLLRNSGQRTWFMRYAAVFLAVLVAAGTYIWLRTNQAATHYATGKGETKTVILADGSTVTLAANSAIDVVGDWSPEQPRELALQGEAFFSVTHQQNHQKFIVKTPNNLRVEVLGTTFTINEGLQATQVVLNSGKVALYRATDTRPLLMKPGELIEIPKARPQQIIRRSVQPEVYSAWKDNQFVFEDTSLGEIAAIIESEFSYKVVFADDALKDLRVTLRLPDRDLSLLLTALAEIHDLKIDRQTSRIVIARTSAAP